MSSISTVSVAPIALLAVLSILMFSGLRPSAFLQIHTGGSRRKKTGAFDDNEYSTAVFDSPGAQEARRRISEEMMKVRKQEVVHAVESSRTPLRSILDGLPYRRFGEFRSLKNHSGGKRSDKFHMQHRAVEEREGEKKGELNGFGWRFVKYTASPLERDFLEAVRPVERKDFVPYMIGKFGARFAGYFSHLRYAADPNVSTVTSPRYAEECVRYLHNVTHGLPLNDATCGTQGLDSFDADVFSTFEYEFTCLDDGAGDPRRSCDEGKFLTASAPQVGAKHLSYIEPLAGLLRHPQLFLQNDTKRLFDKTYMYVDKWALNHLGYRWQQTTKRALYFDLGANQHREKAEGGASQNWFIPLMQCTCTPPTDLFLWEARAVNQRTLSQNIVGPFQPSYHFYNIPLSSDTDSWNNPLNMLLDKTEPDNIVFLKIDLDHLRLEEELVQQILSVREISGQVDELFLEHRVNMPVLKSELRSSRRTDVFVSTSIELFQRLRERGIRAHSWI